MIAFLAAVLTVGALLLAAWRVWRPTILVLGGVECVLAGAMLHASRWGLAAMLLVGAVSSLVAYDGRRRRIELPDVEYEDVE